MPGRQLRTGFPAALATGLLLGCAATTPSPAPPVETLVVLNSGDVSLTYVELADSGSSGTIQLGNVGGSPHYLTTRGSQIVVSTGAGNTLVHLGLGQAPVIYRFPAGFGTSGSVFVN